MRVLVSAGEASGDLYASAIVAHLRRRWPGVQLFGCAGPKLQALGVEPIVDAASLSVVGLAEVVVHLPRIYGEYRKLVRAAEHNPPDAAILTDSPDFHLRLARHLKRLHVPVFYLVAPQVWAWRQGRVRTIAKLVDKLFCVFPFEEAWFRDRGVDATYIGHPLAALVKPRWTRAEFFARHELRIDRQTLVLLPGSRAGEATRHLPTLLETVRRLQARMPVTVMLASPKGFGSHGVLARFREPLGALSIKVVEDETWDCIAHSDLALAASGTVTVECAILGTPMVTFYKVSPLSWYAGRHLVKASFLSMVNLIAERRVVQELIQNEMTPEGLEAASIELLSDEGKSDAMRKELLAIRQLLTAEGDPLERAADLIATSGKFAVELGA